MRYLFRTDYRQDIALWRHRGDLFWYGLLCVVLLLIPLLLGEFYVGELGGVFIFAIAGVGLMLLVGYTGLISLGHAAFLGIGAYTNSVLLSHGVPFLITLPAAGLVTAFFGAAIGLPTLRMSGLYLAIATLAFGSIVGTVFQKWDSVTGGFDGFAVPTPSVFGIPIETSTGIYYVSLAVLVLVLWLSANLLRTPLGRAMVAIRDSEVSAQSMGIHLARYKTFAFAISAFMTGLAGALVRALRTLSRARFVRRAAVGAVRHHRVRRRARLAARCDPGCDVRAPAAAGHRHHARRPAVRPRPHAGPRTVAVRPHPGAGDPVRAGRHLWPLVEDQTLVPGLSAEAAHRVPPAEILCAIGASAMTFFAAQELSVRFGGIRAVDAVDFEIRQGEVFAIIGPNGAGKTTIFNLISRIYNPTGGKLIFQDRDITQLPAHQIASLGIARTFQNIELFSNATLLQNLLIGRHCHARTGVLEQLLFLPNARRDELLHREKVEDVIAFLGLQRYRDTLIANLPYGVRKVVELGRALCIEPKLLLLDEPSSGLNVEETEGMGFWIEDIKKDLDITVIMVEHDMNLVRQVSDRVMALNYGKVMALGTPEEVQNHPDVIRAYIGGEATA